MAAERALRGQRDEEEFSRLAEVEAQRRRKGQHSLIDYRCGKSVGRESVVNYL